MERTRLPSYIIFCFVFLLLFASSCTNSKSQDKINEEPEKQNVNIDELKMALLDNVNDNIWYSGIYSQYYGFQNQKSEIEIYNNPKMPDMIAVIFKKKFKGSIYEEGFEHFYSLQVWKGGKGYSIAGTTMELKEDVLRERKKELGYTFYQEDFIEFGKVTEPEYPPIDAKREETIKDIEAAIPKAMDSWSFKKGIYKVFLRNFKRTENRTYAVIEKVNGKTWILNVSLPDPSEKWKPYGTKFFDISESEWLSYNAKQYMKFAILNKEIKYDGSPYASLEKPVP